MKKIFALFAVLAGAFATILALSVPAAAVPARGEYSAQSFAAAQRAGKTIVVDVHADWCPTCRAQEPILNELRGEDALANVVFMRVNFDEDKAFLRAHRVPRQSTILVFKGNREVARSIAETNRSRLRGVVLGAI